MKDARYVRAQLAGAGIDLLRCLDDEVVAFRARGLDAGSRCHDATTVAAILAECESLAAALPDTAAAWPRVRDPFARFLRDLPSGAYLTPAECYAKGKRRDYRLHVEYAVRMIGATPELVLDVAGRTGWASTVLRHLGVTGAVTIELNPFNVIAGRYVWGHRAVEQGDAGSLRRTRIGGTDLSAGGQAAAIFVRYALEHFQDLRQVFAEFAHVLRPGGKVVLIVGQTFSAEPDSGDMRAFPTVESVYAAADAFAPVHFELHRNNDTQRDEFMVCLVKPDTGGAVTRRESAARAVRAAPVGLWSRARVGVAWRWRAWRERAGRGGAA